jgi:fatty-acyl-CoA synthase
MPRTWAQAITVGDALLRSAADAPDTTALVTPVGRWSYGEVAERSSRIARGLMALGVGPGDHVGMLIPNSLECLTTLFGVALTGAAVVPINARYRSVELATIARQAALVAIVTSDLADAHVDFLSLLDEALPGLSAAPHPDALAAPGAPRLRSVVMLGARQEAWTVSGSELERRAATVSAAELEHRRARVGLRDPWMVLYTSGTTALPRGCLISHEGQVRTWGAVADALRLEPGETVWDPCPMFHVAGIGVAVACVLSAATILTALHFEPTAAIELLAAERPTVLYPAYANIILDVINHPAAADLDLSSARRMLIVGAPETIRGVQARLPHCTIVSTFGMSESSGCSTTHDLDDSLTVRSETVGLPLPGLEARIVDLETLAELPPGTPGEIQLRGPLLCDGYYNDPERTAVTFLPDGWLRTGDHGTLDADGRLAFLGRLRDIVRVGGENVAPTEVEAHLMTHPAVHLAVIVGVPDPRLDEVVAAFVECRAGATVSEAELIAHCRGRIASFKVPRHIRFVTGWPMSATKILRSELRAGLLAELAESAAPLGRP